MPLYSSAPFRRVVLVSACVTMTFMVACRSAGPERMARQALVGDQLFMDTYLLTLDATEGPVPVAIFVSRGLAAFGQKEIALVVKLRSGESTTDLHENVSALYVACLDMARSGHTVDVGGRTLLDSASKPLLGRGDFLGVVYTRLPGAVSEEILEDGVLAIVVTSRELKISEETGQTRLLGQLGKRSRYFPTPPWSDRDRPEVLTEGFRSRSLVRGLPCLWATETTGWISLAATARAIAGPTPMPDFNIDVGELCVHLEIDPGSRVTFGEAFQALPESLPLVVFTGVNLGIPRYLTWEPGQNGMGAISDFERRADRRCAGNFVLFVPGQDQNGVRVIEDGFGVTLRTADWEKVRGAVSAGRGVRVADSLGTVIFDVSMRP